MIKSSQTIPTAKKVTEIFLKSQGISKKLYKKISKITKFLEPISSNKTQKQSHFLEINLKLSLLDKEQINPLWSGRKVCFVTNELTKIKEDTECFDKVLEKKYIFVPGADAFAKSLAYHLPEKGYQALDMGGYYDRIYAQDHTPKEER